MSAHVLPFRCDEATFRALAVAIVPDADQLNEPEWLDLYRIISIALDARPAVARRQLAAFVRVLNLGSLLRHRRCLARTSVAQRQQLLHSVERSRLVLLRRGLWGLRTLVLMGFYGRSAAHSQIGYRGHIRGWLRPAEAGES